MQVKFGEFEQVEKPDEIKVFLKDHFEKVKSDKYRSIYIAYPHQSYSEEYAPKNDEEETLQLYLFSIPSEVSAEPARFDNFTFDGNNHALQFGQRDYLKLVTPIPKGYEKVEDEEGRTFGLTKQNKMWILIDLFHGYKTDSGPEKILTPFLSWIKETVIQPLSTDDIKGKLIAKIETMISGSLDTEISNIKARVKTLQADTTTQEARLIELLKSLSKEMQVLKVLENAPKKTADEIFDNMTRMPFVKQVKFSSGRIIVESNPIAIGPFNYGSWKIMITKGDVKIEHENKGSVLHPYEYSDHHFCFGGFNVELFKALSEGDLPSVLAYCRMEITNYSVATKQSDIELYFKKTMGARAFNAILDDIRKEKLPDCDSINISAIDGKKFTFVGLKSVNGRTIPTASRVEIDYDE